MTHSGGRPHAVGDKGQQYEVRATGYPKATESVIGWTTSYDGAIKLAAAIRKAPSCVSTTIYDRVTRKAIVTHYVNAVGRGVVFHSP